MRIKFIKSFITTLILLMVFGCHRNPAVESFTADMVQEVNNQRVEGKLFVKGNKYRMDIKEGEAEISILVNRESGKHKVIMHSRKVAYEYLNTSSKSLKNNPFEYFNYLLEKHSSRREGSEVINGYECRKIEVYKKDRHLTTAWISKKLNWPIKIEMAVKPKKDVILENIKEEPVEKNLFELPEDYRFFPLPEAKKEKATAKAKPKKPENLGPKQEAVLKELEKNGIELKNKEGTIKVREFGATVISRCFHGLKFFLIIREKEAPDGTISGKIPVAKAAISKDNKNIYIHYSPETDVPLNDGLKMCKDQNVKINNEEDVKNLGKALILLYLSGARLKDVESLGENKWAIYRKSSSEYLDGFILEVSKSGEIIELNYKSKIKRR